MKKEYFFVFFLFWLHRELSLRGQFCPFWIIHCLCAGNSCNVTMYPPPLAHARPCLSTGWALNRRFEEILGPLFLWSRMEDWVFVECLYREKGLSRVCDSALCS